MSVRLAVFVMLSLAPALEAAAGGWSVRIQHWQSEPLEVPGAIAEETERRSDRVAWHEDHAHGQTGIAYEYQPLVLETGAPLTNGFLHQIDLTHGMLVGETRVDLSLGLHGSSNVFEDGEFLLGGGNLRSDALVGRFRVMHPIAGWFDAVGVAGDYRFGRFLVYPRLAKSVSPGDTVLTADLPVTLGWRDAGGRWRVGLDRYGEHWATLDDSETLEGKLYLDEWRLTGRYRIWKRGQTHLNIGAGVSFDTEVRFTDVERGRVQGEMDPALFGFVEIGR